MKLRSAFTAVAVAAGVVAGSISLAPAAFAATRINNCPVHDYCLFPNTNFRGNPVVFTQNKLNTGVSDFRNFRFPGARGGPLNDRARSVVNNTSKPVDNFPNVNFDGRGFQVGAGNALNNLNNATLNNTDKTLSSARTSPGALNN